MYKKPFAWGGFCTSIINQKVDFFPVPLGLTRLEETVESSYV